MPATAVSRGAAQGGARLGLCPSRAAPARRHADAAVGGVSSGGAGRLSLQSLVRAVPRLGKPAVADDAPGSSRRRADVRRLCRSDHRSDRRQDRRDPAVMGASNYTYAEATLTQSLPDWIGAHVRALAFMRGVPAQLVPDNPKVGVDRANWYEPGLNRTYLDLATHYRTAILPTRVRKPRDKAKVEVAVLVVERWILARLRNRRFFSLAELNQAIAELVADLNARPMRRLGVSRRDLFLELDRPALKELPAEPYQYAEWRMRRVGLDYHVDIDGHYYSVPHRLIREQLDARITERTIELFCKGERVAVHMRGTGRGRHTTIPEHMPSAHRRYAEWTIERIGIDAAAIGPSTAKLTALILESRPHPEQGYRACIGILRLVRHYGAERLEAACNHGLEIGARSYSSIQSILKHGLDHRPPRPAAQRELLLDHPNIRGPRYYH